MMCPCNLDAWLHRSQDRFTSPTIQNEMLEIMATAILSLVGRQFSIMFDETTDISNTEQLVFCIRYVDDQLNSHEEFIGLHSLDSTTALSITLRDTLDTVEEMTKLIKKSPKREAVFKKVKNDIASESPKIRLLAPTRWTVHAAALVSISENYSVLRDTWCLAQQQSSDSEMRARISGDGKQMESFNFFFGVKLGRIVLNMADNLSAALQGSSVSASDGQRLMSVTVTTLESIRSEESFTLFWQKTEQRRQQFGILEPTLPRQRKVPRRSELGSSIFEAQTSVEVFYRQTYYEVIDYVVQAI